MTVYRAAAFLGVLLTFTPFSPVRADPEECRAAIDQYNAAVGDVSGALRRYANCVRDSHAHDDCSSEFRRLRSAQNNFETAVSDYGMKCQ